MSSAAWTELMADSAAALARKRDAEAQQEEDYSTELGGRLQRARCDVARHSALSGALFAAIQKAAKSQGVSAAQFIPGKDSAEINASLSAIAQEGRRRFKAGVGFDDLRAQGMKYKPPGVR